MRYEGFSDKTDIVPNRAFRHSKELTNQELENAAILNRLAVERYEKRSAWAQKGIFAALATGVVGLFIKQVFYLAGDTIVPLIFFIGMVSLFVLSEILAPGSPRCGNCKNQLTRKIAEFCPTCAMPIPPGCKSCENCKTRFEIRNIRSYGVRFCTYCSLEVSSEEF